MKKWKEKKKEKSSSESESSDDDVDNSGKMKTKRTANKDRLDKKEKKKEKDRDDSQEKRKKEKKRAISDPKNEENVEIKGEREKTQDVEKFKGAHDDTAAKKVKDSDLVDETGTRVIEDASSVLSLKDLVDIMNIMMVSQRKLDNPYLIEIGDVTATDLPSPRIEKSIPREFSLKFDDLAKWCVFQGKIRGIRNFATYEEYLKSHAELIHATAEEFHRLFRITERQNLQNIRVIPPEFLGSCPDWDRVPKDGIIQSYYDNAVLFEPAKQGHGYLHRIFLNPCLGELSNATQAFLTNIQSGIELRHWIDGFVRRKRHKNLIGMDPVYGDRSTFWLRRCSPRRLPTLLGALPHSSSISIIYGSQFLFPEARLSVLDMSSLAATMNVSMTADGMNTVISSSPSSANFDDFQRILMSMLFPVQVQLRIKYDNRAAPGIDACAALCAKLLLSSSPLTRNISVAASLQTDLAISDWLITLGYSRPNLDAPLDLTYRLRSAPQVERDSLWRSLATTEQAGRGWLNMDCDDAFEILEPLYDRVTRLPRYGDMTEYFDGNDYGDTSVLHEPPIWGLIMTCLGEAVLVNSKQTTQMRGFLTMLRVTVRRRERRRRKELLATQKMKKMLKLKVKEKRLKMSRNLKERMTIQQQRK